MFGKLVHWHSNERSKAYVWVKCLFDEVDSISRSLVIRQGFRMGGVGWSWTRPLYILNNEFADPLLADYDQDPPNNSNPHPFQPPVLPDEPEDPDEQLEE